MKQITTFLLATVFFLVEDIQAQVRDTIPCPVIELLGPTSYTVAEGKTAVFTVKPSWGKLTKQALQLYSLTYNWAVSNGSIESGQGTASISVNTQGLKGQTITATAEIGGLKPECMSIQSMTIDIIEPQIKVATKGKGKTKSK